MELHDISPNSTPAPAAPAAAAATSDRSRGRRPFHQAARDGNENEISRLWENADRFHRRAMLESLDEQHQTPLHVAARFNRLSVVKSLLLKNADPNKKTKDEGLTPLHLCARIVPKAIPDDWTDDRAAQEDGRDLAFVLLKKGARLNEQDTYGMTALHHAIQRGNKAMAKFLIDYRGILLDQADKQGMTPLHEAIQQGNETISLLLIDRGADIFAVDGDLATPLHFCAQEGHNTIGQAILQKALEMGEKERVTQCRNAERATCLHLAVDSGHFEMAKLCIQMGVPIDAEMENGAQALHLASRNGYQTIAELLIDAGASVKARNSDDARPLHRAARYDKAEMVEFLISKGAVVDATDEDGFTPLMTASFWGNNKCVRVLLDRGADVEHIDSQDRTSVHLAAKGGHVKTVKMLLDEDTGVSLANCRDNEDYTPLHFAAQRGYVRLVDLLLSRKAKLNAQNDVEKTPLHLASEEGRVEVVRKILKIDKSTANDEDEKGNQPLHLACLEGKTNVVRALLAGGASVDARNASSWTPLDCAAYGGHADVVTALLDGEAEVDSKDRAGVTPLHLASRENHEDVVKILIERDADVGLVDTDGLNALDYAIDHESSDVAEVIIKSNGWDRALGNFTRVDKTARSRARVDTPLRKLIKKMPDVAEMAFNRCMSSNTGEISKRTKKRITQESDDYEVTFNYRFLDDIELADKFKHEYRERETREDDATSTTSIIDQDGPSFDEAYYEALSSEGITSNHTLNVMVANDRESLLGHPLVISLLARKWKTFGRYVYYVNLLVFIAFLSFLTSFALLLVPPLGNQSVIAKMEGVNFNIRDPTDCTSSTEAFLGVARWIVIIFAGVRLGIFELFQIIYLGRSYFALSNAVSNIVEWCAFTLSILFALPLGQPFDESFKCSVQVWQWECGTMAVFFSWANLLVNIRKLPKLGIYIVMFLDVLATFVKFFIVGLLLIIAFGLSFYMCFPYLRPFVTPARSLAKTAVMTTGEFEYSSYFNADAEFDQLRFEVVSYLLWMIFLVLMPILLMNLLVGLAVDDIQTVQENAKLTRLAMQVELVLGVEAILPSFIRRRVAVVENVFAPNLRPSLASRFRHALFERSVTTESIAQALHPKLTPIEELEERNEELAEEVASLKKDVKRVITQNTKALKLLQDLVASNKVHASGGEDSEDEDDEDEADGSAVVV